MDEETRKGLSKLLHVPAPRKMTSEELNSLIVFFGTQPARPALSDILQFFNKLFNGSGAFVEMEPRLCNPYFFIPLTINGMMPMPNGHRCDANGICELLNVRSRNSVVATVQLPPEVQMYPDNMENHYYRFFLDYKNDLITSKPLQFKSFILGGDRVRIFFDGVDQFHNIVMREIAEKNCAIDPELFDE
ncbi:unnamed protein product [Caenorhabditis bovis]|uniref:Uncharacterized protein n=1 Tax=Caenorhabditis bovis TaxID=2654633 RepID=A0A8S1ETE1_9PELO|nr:unnamed protein product [Caenorhabditis bovis]